MSLISRLFNKKGQQKGVSTAKQTTAHYNRDEEDLLDGEDPEDNEETAEEDIAAEAIADHEKAQEIYEVLEREILPAKIICPDCGGITLEGLEFCDKCGGELQ
jgi:hypothetical protein